MKRRLAQMMGQCVCGTSVPMCVQTGRPIGGPQGQRDRAVWIPGTCRLLVEQEDGTVRLLNVSTGAPDLMQHEDPAPATSGTQGGNV